MKQAQEDRQSNSCITADYIPLVSVEVSDNRRQSLWQKVCRLYQSWHLRYASRRVLQSLTREQLQDIGLTREDVAHECRKNFWQ